MTRHFYCVFFSDPISVFFKVGKLACIIKIREDGTMY